MAVVSGPNEGQIQRGYKAQARFFHVINNFKGPKPGWLLEVQESAPHIDGRGIDGFAWVSLYLFFRRRIPLQLKSAKADMVDDIRANAPVYVHIPVDVRPETLMDNLIARIEQARWTNFEPYIKGLEKSPIQKREEEKIRLIQKYRQKYRWQAQ